MKKLHYLREFIISMNQLLNEELTGHAATRAQYVKYKLIMHWPNLPGNPGLPGYPDIDKWLEKLAEVDPTQKKINIPRMAKLAVKDPVKNKMEDIDRVGTDLAAFETYKSRIANKDINQYKSFDDLYDVIAPFLVPKEKTPEEKAKEKEAAKLAAIKDQIDMVYNGPEGWIRIPKTVEAACFLGQNTRWCTASKGNNMFSHYNKSDVMFVVYDKASKKRFQMHIDSGQFADEADRNQQFKSVPEWAWDPIIKWYKANNPHLGIKHLMTLGAHSKGENLAAGTVHADLLDLMRLYDVS